MDCTEAETFYSINEKIGSEEPVGSGDSLSTASQPQEQQQTSKTSNSVKRRRKRPQQTSASASFGVGSSSIQSKAEEPQITVDILQYDITIPDYDGDDVPGTRDPCSVNTSARACTSGSKKYWRANLKCRNIFKRTRVKLRLKTFNIKWHIYELNRYLENAQF